LKLETFRLAMSCPECNIGDAAALMLDWRDYPLSHMDGF